jgi:hypothetical protein
MSKYDDFRESYKDRPAEQRLTVLRAEMLTPLAVIHGFATLLARINLEDSSTFPKDYGDMVVSILQAHNDIHSVLNALTLTSDPPND